MNRLAGLPLLLIATTLGAVEVSLEHVEPCNVLFVNEHDGLRARVSKTAEAQAVTARVRNYWGEEVLAAERQADPAVDDGRVHWDLAQLGPGYYEIEVSANGASDQASFAIAPRIERSAAAVRDGGYRFGLKMWYLSDAWWRGNAQWNEREATDATCKLGLQWTRALMQQRAHLDTVDLLTDFPMNAVLKVERFPLSCYDEERYGPVAEWEQANGKGQWSLKTVPKEAAYKAWLTEELARIPAEQQVFEVWNEAWDKLSPEDLALISNWIAEVILADRPDAIIGPNLKGSTSKYSYDAKYIAAGGMRGMRMVALHPYAGSENRGFMRAYKAWLAEQCGRPIDIYVTEYGSHSTPEGPAKRSEQEQARRVVRQSLALYAEDVKAFTPHWMGQREQDRTYHEHWFGFYRLNHQPKPNLVALATAARLVDASTYRGDLWFGPGVGAMVFSRDGQNVLALFTKEGEQTVEVTTGVEALSLVDFVGNEQPLASPGGQVQLTVGGEVTYLVGIADSIVATASTELDPRRWPQGDDQKKARNERVIPRLAMPTFDGKVGDWASAFQVSLLHPKVNGADASGIGYLGWDEQYLYIAINMRDNQVMNRQPRPKLYLHDSLELFVSTEARDQDSGYGPMDRQFFVTPDSSEEQPIVGHVADREAGLVVDVEGSRQHIGTTSNGWVVELALPWSALPPFTPEAGARMAIEMRVNDADESHERWKIDPEDASPIKPSDPTSWSIIVLGD